MGIRISEPPRGMDDLLPGDMAMLRRLQEIVRDLFALYGYQEIETPDVEYYELFEVKSGEELRARMFTFQDLHGRLLVLRPEMTAPVARLVAGKLSRLPQPIRLGYVADCYRLDEPQWGRKRRFYHGGFELFGSRSAEADAEILQVCWDFVEKSGLGECYLKLGHVGIHRALMDEAKIGEEIQDRILSLIDRGRVDEAMRVAEGEGVDEGAVSILRELLSTQPIKGSESMRRVKDVLSPVPRAVKQAENLEEIIDIASYFIPSHAISYHPGFARGLAYYTGFIFELYGVHANVALMGGGRYDRLVELFGGRPTPGVGAAIGLTRVMQYIVDKLQVSMKPSKPETTMIYLSSKAKGYALRVALMLRRRGIGVEVEVMNRSLSEALSNAEKRGFRYAVIIGDREVERGSFQLRYLPSRSQREYSVENLDEVAEVIAAR